MAPKPDGRTASVNPMGGPVIDSVAMPDVVEHVTHLVERNVTVNGQKVSR